MTTNVQQLPRVPRIVNAYCPRCDARFGRHDEGDCPGCGDALDVSIDRASFVIMVHEEHAADLAREHAPSADADYAVCKYCAEKTPLALESAQDVAKASDVDDIATIAEEAAEATGTQPYFVRGLVNDAYAEAYRDACAPAEECFVCHDAQFDEDMDCGHTRHGRECPAAE